MKKTTIIRITSFYLVLLVVCLGVYLKSNQKYKRYKQQVQYTYQAALETLSVNIGNIEDALKKSVYASSKAQFTNLTVLLSRESAAAKSAIASLPVSQTELESINKFLSQVGEYSLALSKKAATGGEIEQEERDNLFKLGLVAGKIHSGIDDIYTMYSADGILSNENATQEGENLFSDDIEQIEQSLTDYPTLIYDGPFSDHISDSNPALLENSEAVSRDEAREIAARAIDVEMNKLSDGYDSNGALETYGFNLDNDSFAAVTKKGGYLVYLRLNLPKGQTNFTYAQAEQKAKEFLQKIGYKNMQSNYYFTNEGVYVINFAYQNGSTTCYTDLIKVGVDLTSGKVVFLDAKGYINNHKSRNIATPKYTVEQAKEVLSKNLVVEGVLNALIPTASKGEVHCYEFKCKGINNEEVLVYINTLNLNEEQIFILLKTDGGILTK